MGKKKGKNKAPETPSSGGSSSQAPVRFSPPPPAQRSFPPVTNFPKEKRVIAGMSNESSREAKRRTQERLSRLTLTLDALKERLGDNIQPGIKELLKLKYALINTLEVLIKLRENFKHQYYNGLIFEDEKNPNPVFILRNFMVHSDMVLENEKKYYMYRDAAKLLVQLKNLVPGRSDTPINLTSLKHYPLYESAYIPVDTYMPNKASVYKLENNDNTIDLIEKGLKDILTCSKKLTITDDTTIDMLRNDYAPLLMSIAQVAEIFRQLPDNAVIRVHGERLDTIILPYFTQVRAAVFHYPHPFEVSSVQTIIETARALFPVQAQAQAEAEVKNKPSN